jgi:phenylacetate-CoA ligase
LNEPTQSHGAGFSPAGSQMTAAFGRYLTALARTEWLPPADLLHYQRQLLERLLRHASTQVPFYRERLACLFTPDGNIDFSRWHEVPIVERAEVIAHGAEMRPPALSDLYGEIRRIRTNGTTTIPLSLAANELVIVAANAALTRMARWFGLDTARPLAKIRVYQEGQETPYPDGVVQDGWSAADPEAVSYGLELRTPVDLQLEWLARRKAPYLQTAPSNALQLAYAATPQQARDLGVEFIFGVGETVSDEVRATVRRRLGARLAAVYSCQEIGFVATECPAAAHYHVVAENAIVDIVGEDGRPVAPGELGRVVVTGLYNYAMPFIRYAIGDVASWAVAPCRCGRSLPVIAQVEGRTRSAFVFEDGRRMWPRGWDAREMRALVPFREFQMVQLDHRRIELRYVPDDSGRAVDSAGLAAFARGKFHPSVEIIPVPLAAMPRGPSGKFEQFVSLVPLDGSQPRAPQ